MSSRLTATVRGRVQGVGFRWFVVRHASRLRLVGWVSNTDDGSVAVTAEGGDEALDELIGLLHEGPAGASVERVETELGPAVGGLRGFNVRAGGHSGD